MSHVRCCCALLCCVPPLALLCFATSHVWRRCDRVPNTGMGLTPRYRHSRLCYLPMRQLGDLQYCQQIPGSSLAVLIPCIQRSACIPVPSCTTQLCTAVFRAPLYCSAT
eukprot:766768-Rhodomonas_salina.1